MCEINQSAAKPLSDSYGESSQTILKGSTLNDNSGSGVPLPSKVEGDDIVESKSKTFIEKSVKLHGNKYNYINVNYINAKTKVKIICPIHGEFEQTPDKHLNTKYCCPDCNLIFKTENIKKNKGFKRIESFNNFHLKLLKKFPDVKVKLIEEWNGICKTNINVLCGIHGNVVTNCESLISKQRVHSCTKCSEESRVMKKNHTINDIINHLNNLYNDKYVYIFPNDYINKKDKIKIICNKHGEFTRSVAKLLSGQDCSRCKIDELIDDNRLVGGYSYDLFINKPELKNNVANLYYLSINNGELFKIGISINNPSSRIKSLKSKSKGFIQSCEIITVKEMTLFEAFNIEQKILNENSKFRVKLNWSTELFNKDISYNVLQYFT